MNAGPQSPGIPWWRLVGPTVVSWWYNLRTRLGQWLVPALGIEPRCACGWRLAQLLDGNWTCGQCTNAAFPERDPLREFRDVYPIGDTSRCSCLLCDGTVRRLAEERANKIPGHEPPRGTWSNGGWGVVSTEYPEEGTDGPYAERALAEAALGNYDHPEHMTVVELSPAQCRELAGTCEECGGPADFEDAERVQCDCGTTVCSACCVAVDGESYCSVCAEEKRTA